MKIKLGQLEGLKTFLNEFLKIAIPVKVSYKVGRFIRNVLESEYSTFSEKRVSICKEFAKKDEAGNPVIENNNFKIDDDKINDFNLKIAETYAIEIDLPFATIDIDEMLNVYIPTELLLALQELEFINK